MWYVHVGGDLSLEGANHLPFARQVGFLGLVVHWLWTCITQMVTWKPVCFNWFSNTMKFWNDTKLHNGHSQHWNTRYESVLWKFFRISKIFHSLFYKLKRVRGSMIYDVEHTSCCCLGHFFSMLYSILKGQRF